MIVYEPHIGAAHRIHALLPKGRISWVDCGVGAMLPVMERHGHGQMHQYSMSIHLCPTTASMIPTAPCAKCEQGPAQR